MMICRSDNNSHTDIDAANTAEHICLAAIKLGLEIAGTALSTVVLTTHFQFQKEKKSKR